MPDMQLVHGAIANAHHISIGPRARRPPAAQCAVSIEFFLPKAKSHRCPSIVQCGIDGAEFIHAPPSSGPESLGIPQKAHFPLEAPGVLH
jgi:hypothetical protein